MDDLTKADKIEHYVEMIQALTDGFDLATDKYVDDLALVALNGGYATTGTLEEIRLGKLAKDFRAMADSLDGIRNKLIANSPSSLSILREREEGEREPEPRRTQC